MSQSRTSKAIQYIELLEEYHQAEDTLYDTSVTYAEPGSPEGKSGLPPLIASFSLDKPQVDPPPQQTPQEAQQQLTRCWDASWTDFKNSCKAPDQIFTVSCQTAHAAAAKVGQQVASTMNDLKNDHGANLHKLRMATTNDRVFATVQAIKESSAKTRLPGSLAAKARVQRNPVFPRDFHRTISPIKSRTPANEAAATKLLAETRSPQPSVYQTPSPEIRSAPPTPVQQPGPTKILRQDTSGTVVSSRVDAEDTSCVNTVAKEQAANKRAARAKKKGAPTNFKASATPSPPLTPKPLRTSSPKREQPPPLSLPTAAAPVFPLPAVKNSHDEGSSTAGVSYSPSYAPSAMLTTASGPRLKRIANKETRKGPKDPPGISRKGYNDDASVAPPRPQALEVVQVPPKSIDLDKIGESQRPTSMPWASVITAIAIPSCTGAQEPETPPPPVRPCDIPRGSELKKKNGYVSCSVGLGEFMNAFGLNVATYWKKF